MHLEQKKDTLLLQIKKFIFNSRRFIKTCRKPKKPEITALTKGHLIGLAFLGVFGYIIKVIHIPINNIIAGSSS